VRNPKLSTRERFPQAWQAQSHNRDVRSSGEILRAFFSELYCLIEPGETSQAAVAVLRAFPIETRLTIATEIMARIRTNALPSHRVLVARALGDALREDGVNGPDLSKGLKKGHDTHHEQILSINSPQMSCRQLTKWPLG